MRSTNPIATLLGGSPFKPLQAHMRIVKQCVAEVPPLFEALITKDQTALVCQNKQIYAQERAADKLEQQLRAHLHKSLLMPVDRRDLLDLIDMQDNIADTARDIAGLLLQRDMSIPEVMNKPLMVLVQRCVDTCNQAANIIEELDELIESGFRGRQATKVDEMISQLSTLEGETDEMGRILIRTLFSLEDDMKPVSIMLWYQMINWIGNLADYAEKVGDRMRLLIAR